MSSVVSVDLGVAASALDLEWRLKQIPNHAQARGIFLNMLRDDMERLGLSSVPPLRQILSVARRSYALYPISEMVEAYAIAGALVDTDPRKGMRTLFTRVAVYSSRTWYGRVFAKYLTPDPVGAFTWLERSREYIANYGQWRVERRDAEHIVLHMFDEYFWIDGTLQGGCEGMLEACGVKGEVKAELDSPFDGRLDVRWTPR